MSLAPGRPRGPVGVVTALSGPSESVVAAALAPRRDLALVRRCADVAELLSVAEVGLAVVAVVNEAFAGLDADVVDRLRRAGLAVLGVVDPDRGSSERLRAWAVPVVELAGRPAAAGGEDDDVGARLALAVSAAVDGTGAGTAAAGGHGRPPGTGGGPGERARTGADAGPCADPGESAEPDRPAADGRGPGPATGPTDPPCPDTRDGPRPLEHARTVDGAAGATTSVPELAGPVDPVPAQRTTRGRLVAVWGPAGAPGRTTVAVAVAAELAAAGHEVLLVDGDTYAASVAQVLGLLDESPGLVAAVRAGLDGRLDPALLARLAPVAAPRLRVLTGLTRAARWSELRPAGLEAVLLAGRRLVDVVVVDLAPPLEEDEELSYDTAAPRRNGTALDVLRSADDVLVVGSADPVGLQRLVRGLQDLGAAVPGTSPVVVVNRVRAGAVGRSPVVRVREALERFAGVRVRHLVPDDRPALDRALLAGRTLDEQAPDSPARQALRSLALTFLAPWATATGTRDRRSRRAATSG